MRSSWPPQATDAAEEKARHLALIAAALHRNGQEAEALAVAGPLAAAWRARVGIEVLRPRRDCGGVRQAAHTLAAELRLPSRAPLLLAGATACLRSGEEAAAGRLVEGALSEPLPPDLRTRETNAREMAWVAHAAGRPDLVATALLRSADESASIADASRRAYALGEDAAMAAELLGRAGAPGAATASLILPLRSGPP